MNLTSVVKTLISMISAALIIAPMQGSIAHETYPNTIDAASIHQTHKASHPSIVSHSVTHHTVLVATPVPPAPLPFVELGTAGDSAVWMNEALSELGYLPVSFTSQTSITATLQKLDLSMTNGHLTPLSGMWTWRSKEPESLTKLWNPAKATVLTQGAIMAFEAQHHLAIDGIAGPHVYAALKAALATKQQASVPYTYVTVTKSTPERLDAWRGGKVVFTSLANTGIAATPTPNGTWPVYLRLISQEMKGKSPDGSKYDDPGVPYVNYFYKGSAIHGFPRASYGSPQSLGCVELPVAAAKQLYNLLSYGTLVTVAPS